MDQRGTEQGKMLPQPHVVAGFFSDLDQMAAAVANANVEHVPLASPRSPFEARYLRIDLGDGASVETGDLSIPHLTRAQFRKGIYQVGLIAGESPGLSWNGHAMDRSTALLFHGGSEFQATAPGIDHWVGITFPEERLREVVVALTRRELDSTPENCRTTRLDDGVRDALGEILHRAVEVARADGAAFDAPEARRALSQSLLSTVARALDHLPRRPPDRERTLLSHSRIVGTAEECMRVRLGEPLYVADLCLATGASERTLRSAFGNVYGMGPNRLLKLRRINQVRRELEHGGEHTLVSEVAQRHGFWDLGRFAGDYKRVVGESPSQTLRRARLALVA